MAEDRKVSVKNYILHILDSGMQMPVLSACEHPPEDDARELLEKYITRVLRDEELKSGSFTADSERPRELCAAIASDSSLFVSGTQEMAEILFSIMQSNVDIPSADFLCCLFELDGVSHLGLLKLNYRTSFIHYVEETEEGRVNLIVKQRQALPGETQKVDECALINLQDQSVKLLEKKYEINGEKMFYFSSVFLGCTGEISEKQKAKAFKKATESFSKKYYEENPAKTAEVKAAVASSLDRNEAIHVEEVAEQAFRQNPQMQQAYIEHMDQAGFSDRVVRVSEKVAEKTFIKQRIKTDTGVEISLPVSFYNEQKVEFINNIDGTISILIKNAGRITGM